MLKIVKHFTKNIKIFNNLNIYKHKYLCTCPPYPLSDTKNDDKPRRPIRQEQGPVRLGFVPDEWFMFFFKKTGFSGFGTFCFTIGTTLVSKEFYVMEHEYYNGLSMLILCIAAVKYVGPELAKLLDSEIDAYEASANKHKENARKEIENNIDIEKKVQYSSEGQLMLVEAKRENVALQREAAYRERFMHAYRETVKRLDYCTMRETVEKAIAKRCMADWVVEQVQASVTKEIQEKSITKCIADLKYLGDTYAKLKAAYPPEVIDSDRDKKQ